MKKGVTIKDIARKLNMSVSTVSKALSNDPSISILTRERVQQLAKEWNYIPNEAARHFKLNKSFTIGLIIPNLLDQFYVLAINGVEGIAEKQNYNVILTQSHEDVINEEKITNMMISNRVDGVIVAITKNTVNMLLFQKLISMGIPVVFIAREPQSQSFNFVSSNNQEGAFDATAFLIKKGHSRIAHIMGPESMQTSQVRFEGYKQALIEHGISFDDALVKVADFSETATANAMKELMKLKEPPTAVFTFKNYITLDAIEYLKDECPAQLDRIDFVGFGNLPLLQYLDHKPAASIEENSFEMGTQAAELLFRIINNKDADENPSGENIRIPCRLVIHEHK
ncbi:MAG: LacI family DNA-binding transcriptional regulator [Ferruginibacter sp.]